VAKRRDTVDKFVESAGTKNEDRGSLRRELFSRVSCGKMQPTQLKESGMKVAWIFKDIEGRSGGRPPTTARSQSGAHKALTATG